MTAPDAVVPLEDGDHTGLAADGPLSPAAEERRVPVLDAVLRGEYEQRWRACSVRPEWIGPADRIGDGIVRDKAEYRRIETATGAPWFVVAAIHSLESNRNFKTHLANGDPLTAPTVHVPKGRPPEGDPPFAFWESAIDALRLKGFHVWKDWSVAGAMFKLEEYNGWGYRLWHSREAVLTPYLASGSTCYERGKYDRDGHFDPALVSQQCGAMVILRRMADRGLIPAWSSRPAGPVLRYSGGTVLPQGEPLQRFLNGLGLPVDPLLPDGKLGPRSSDAFKVATGFHLLGDPRQP
jgi:lysozyme family protein